MRESTVVALQAMGHAARGNGELSATLADLAAHPTDIVVLASGESDGYTLLKSIRNAHPTIGILVISALGRSRDKVDGYSNGADIYLIKPASNKEIGAAIRAIARRVNPALEADQTDGAHLGSPYILHTRSLQLIGPCALAHVSDTEQQVLSAFSKASDHRLDLAQLREITGKHGVEPSKATLEVQMVRLRKKLETIGAHAPTIKAIRGSGYQLCVPLVVNSQFLAT